ncbi:unnamed protein product [Didymodactylos carnosus]|uniref:PLD phosphodiesterase domain-containing protein n=1 Tax=Didymodactylos carnosus TaxID=1234261 RepID=A0A816CPG7_9BILA|nr:unnamed protein product [Didymodactylos carnosus]CAF4518821.1 unnamed protein product [Didymodactylos carnosus]
MDAIKNLHQRKTIFTYGVTQSEGGDVNVFPPGSSNGIIVPFSFLSKHVPQPFVKEWSGGMGQVIHDKFIIIDFNDKNPQLFTGSSNLAAGGEEQNNDNLLAFTDPNVAQLYAVEAIRLVDHYHFRAVLQNSSETSPVMLRRDDWCQSYYDPRNFKCQERILLAK